MEQQIYYFYKEGVLGSHYSSTQSIDPLIRASALYIAFFYCPVIVRAQCPLWDMLEIQAHLFFCFAGAYPNSAALRRSTLALSISPLLL